jgi:nicotinamidase-related amidase
VKRRGHSSPDPRDAILIVDLQAGFKPPTSLVKQIEKYSLTFRRRIFTKFINPPGSMFRQQLDYHALAPGTAETQLLIRPTISDLVFKKASYGLRAHHVIKLKSLNLREIVVCGVDTDACVLAALFSIFDAGIRARVKPEFCWSSGGLHRMALKVIRRQFGPI